MLLPSLSPSLPVPNEDVTQEGNREHKTCPSLPSHTGSSQGDVGRLGKSAEYVQRGFWKPSGYCPSKQRQNYLTCSLLQGSGRCKG